jgi:DNA mismatch repair protein MutS
MASTKRGRIYQFFSAQRFQRGAFRCQCILMQLAVATRDEPGGGVPVTFHSILFLRTQDRMRQETDELPDFFGDLHLDQIIEAITANKQDYHLQPFFSMPLHDLDAIMYRHEVMQELENPRLFASLQSFAQKMRAVRKQQAQANKLHYTYQQERWFLDAVAEYCDAVTSLLHDLSQVDLQARGLFAFRAYVTDYVHSSRFTSLLTETQQLQADLATVKYCLRIKGNAITVRKYEGEANYSAQVEETFAKFKQGAVKDYLVRFADWPDMNHIEAFILDCVAKLYPDVFARLDAYASQNRDCLDGTIVTFDREMQFYLAYLEYIARLKRVGLSFCYPRVSTTSKEVSAEEAFDLALANKFLQENAPIVCNDFCLQGPERILVVTGPNQGGKTTFARTFGQVHYLASIGCPVPGRQAQLFLPDRLFTHFEREETITNLRGKLQDDLFRIHQTLQQATSNSLIIMNEVFNSTTFQDAFFLSKEILEHILRLDALGVCVTFLDELTTLSEKTVSMTSTVVPDNPAMRTFKIVRRPADGLAYAMAIAEKYRLTYERLKERLPS